MTACPRSCPAPPPPTTHQPATREYALSRALQLNPRCVPAWVALARLYGEAGAAGPAAAALQHARSHEPAVPAIWEAMADVAGLSATGEEASGLWGAGGAGMGRPSTVLVRSDERRAQGCSAVPCIRQRLLAGYQPAMQTPPAQAPQTKQTMRSTRTGWGPGPRACWALPSRPCGR